MWKLCTAHAHIFGWLFCSYLVKCAFDLFRSPFGPLLETAIVVKTKLQMIKANDRGLTLALIWDVRTSMRVFLWWLITAGLNAYTRCLFLFSIHVQIKLSSRSFCRSNVMLKSSGRNYLRLKRNKPNIDRVKARSTVKQSFYQIMASKQIFLSHAKRKCQSQWCDEMECISNKSKI